MYCNLTVARVISFLSFAAMSLCFSSFVITYCWQSYTFHIDIGHSPDNYWANIGWYRVVLVILCAIISGCMVVYNLLLIINPIKFSFLQTQITRVMIYIITGFTVIGVLGDLGIASGFITIIMAVIELFMWLFWKCSCYSFAQVKSVDA